MNRAKHILFFLIPGALAQVSINHAYIGITNVAAGTVPLTITGAAGQTANLLTVESSTPANMFTVDSAGTTTKVSGTFDIKHPLAGTKLSNETRLRHSFVEAPRMDNIYSDSVALSSSGNTSIDIDRHFRMTPGTFSSLNRDPRVIVSGNGCSIRWELDQQTSDNSTILSLQGDSDSSKPWLCQPGTDVTFLVIAERKDEGVKRAFITDDLGFFIPEYNRSSSS
mmetsp:Transcript_13234/g.19795  ORF Transcript_13234/g.19795 Transcript_13234/m.19795 type:complete len:224 (+) Transcript_13234:52-723(+)